MVQSCVITISEFQNNPKKDKQNMFLLFGCVKKREWFCGAEGIVCESKDRGRANLETKTKKLYWTRIKIHPIVTKLQKAGLNTNLGQQPFLLFTKLA